jgi:hypothetical protein
LHVEFKGDLEYLSFFTNAPHLIDFCPIRVYL